MLSISTAWVGVDKTLSIVKGDDGQIKNVIGKGANPEFQNPNNFLFDVRAQRVSITIDGKARSIVYYYGECLGKEAGK